MPADPKRFERFYAVVRLVPKGRVTTYGHVAILAGLPGRARLVGLQVVHAVGLVDRLEGGREAVTREAPLTTLFTRRDFLPDPTGSPRGLSDR